MIDFLAFDRRRAVKVLGVLAFVFVGLQGWLGGLRVNNNSTALAMIHGCVGQAFFAFMVALATITARSWFVARHPVARTSGLKALAVAMLAVAYLQIVLGAWLRHFPKFGALMSHAGMSLLLVAAIAATVWAVRRRRRELPGLLGPVRAMELTLAIQLALGIAAWWMLRPFDGIPREVTTTQALIRTGHQANAALLLGAALTLVLRVYGQAAGEPAGRKPEPEPEPTLRELEVVA
jgi:cytochrome c oxidase assembly protein subunit 15